ncbi:MAG TPA: hybrid sensor histidine kinase/response regulator [Myxococcaceae bacterium]|nr:hybrid sensor histidine kinase/response regulator [Myxococcaceae bacterium]
MRPLRVLHVDDVEGDVRLVERHLRRNGWSVEWTRVESAAELREALGAPWDVILSDFNMPRFSALEALEIVQASKRAGTPFIVVSGSVGEQAAIEVLLRGADDFINKDNLARLVPAIERELDDAQVRLEKQEAQRALAEALGSREELIAIAGHEFRNPLAAMQITVDSLHRSGRAPEHAQALARQVRRLRDLVTRFVDIAALDAGAFELRTSDLDLSLIARREARRITAEPERVRLDAPEPVPVHADRGRLELVVASLLDNALKFGASHPVDIRVHRDEECGLLEVADRGPGLGEAERETVFRPFGKRVSSRHYGGFGLSLWLSRSIVERHGGSIVALPNPGGGALFRVRIPLRFLSRSAPGSSPAGPPPPPASG